MPPTAARPWLAHYDAGVPASIGTYPAVTMLDLLAETARERPDHPMLLFKGRTITAAEVERSSNAFAAALAARGIVKGDRVALVLPNCPQFVIAQFGIWKAGGVVVPVNPTYTERELETVLGESHSKLAVVLTRFYGRVKAAQPRARLQQIVATNIKEYFPPMLSLLFTLFREKKDGFRIRLDAGDAWFQRLIEEGRSLPTPAIRVNGDDPAVLLSSGGTTGTPKSVIGLHRAYVHAGVQIRHWVQSLCAPWTDRIVLPLPLFHVYANIGVQGLAAVGHNPVGLIPNPRDLDDVLATIRKVRPAFFTGVPTLFAALVNHPRVRQGRVDLSSIRVCFSGASALMAETKRRFESLTSGRIVEGYSLTEALMACLLNPLRGTEKLGSIGVPLPDVDVCIVDTEDGTTVLGPGEIGELLVHAPQIMPSYWNNESESLEVLREKPDGRTWLHTGDIGYIDEDGYVFLVDRKKDLIKTSGFQVWPREVEEVLAEHDAVAEVGVAGVGDPLKGEVVKAWVVPRSGTRVTEDELRRWCRGRLAPYKVPASIEFRSELPKTMVGKVMRRALRQSHPA